MSVTTDGPRVGSNTATPGRSRQPGETRLRAAIRRLRERWSAAELFAPPPRSEWPSALRRTRTGGFALLALELVGLWVWSAVQAHRFALTGDFATYLQAAHLLGHGHLLPQSTVGFLDGPLGQPGTFWRNAAELYVVPLAVVLRIWPNVVSVEWMQDLALVGSQVIAFAWICDIAAQRAQRERPGNAATLLALLGLILLVANPWFLWSAAADVHGEPFGAFFALGCARDLHRGRRSAWAWAVGGTLCSVVCASYIAVIGISAMSSARARLFRGGVAAAIALVWFLPILATRSVQLGGAATFAWIANGGAGELNMLPGALPASLEHVTYTQIAKAIISHPQNLFKAMWINHSDLWGTISPAGVIGLVWPPFLLTVFFVLLQGAFSREFSVPGFQNIVVAPLIAVGTIALLSKLSVGIKARHRWTRHRWALPVVIAVLAANSIAWAAIWFPKASRQWLPVTPAAASFLHKLGTRIRPHDEVIASQGIIGVLGARPWIYGIFHLPVHAQINERRVWIIFAPLQGIETADPSETYAAMASVESDPQIHLVAAADGIWAFEWTPPKSTRTLTIGGNKAYAFAPAWALTGSSGNAVRTGPASNWHTSSTTQPGYVIDQAYWRSTTGRYRASVRLSATGGAKVEVWDATTSQLLQRVTLKRTSGVRNVKLTVDLTHTVGQPTVNAFGPWRIAPVQIPGDSLEVRVWSPGGRDRVDVYRVSLTRLRTGG